MSSASVDFLGFEQFPADGVLLVPGRLDFRELLSLASRLSSRRITWLVEENALVEPETREYLARPDVVAATFSENDPNPAEVGTALRPKLENGGLLVFIPSDTTARGGTPCRITGKQLRFVCALGLPVIPLAVSIPAETALATEPASQLPAAILSLGRRIEGERLTVANFHESLFGASEAAFSSRKFLDGSLARHLLAGLKKHARTTAVFDGSDDSTLSFPKLLGAAIALSKEIRAATNKKRVGVILPPGKGGLIANLAVLFANKIPVNLNFTAGKRAVESSIKQADLDKFITADPFVRKVPTFPWPPTRDLLFIERILPTIKKRVIKWILLGRLLPVDLLARLLKLHKGGRGDDEAVLLFTSGSSGEPKGVPLTHRNVLANVCQFGTRLSLPDGASLLGCLPLFHSFGSTVTLWFPVIEGINLVTYPTPLETKRLAELVQQHKIHLLLATPTFLRGYMRRDPAQLAPLQLVVTGAEKLPVNLARSFEEKFGKPVYEGYGLTETSPATNVNLPDLAPPSEATPVIPSYRLGSVGPFLPGQAVRITNAATGVPSSLDQSGVIWLKGANIFPGYLGRPELTEGVIVDGWFKTGDVGRLDEDGFLFIEGRISRFSKIGGEMVPHEALEGHLSKILGLDGEEERKIAVIGVPDEQKGEVIGLLSAVASQTIEQEVVDLRYKLMDAGVPSLWCPKFIVPVDEIPVLASGKLDIKACEKLAREAHR